MTVVQKGGGPLPR